VFACTSSKLRHPNIVALIGLALDPPSVLVVTGQALDLLAKGHTQPNFSSGDVEYMAKGSLFDILHNPDIRLPWKSRLEFAVQTVGRELATFPLRSGPSCFICWRGSHMHGLPTRGIALVICLRCAVLYERAVCG